MNRWDVRTPADALVYITDCTLATVCDMAGKKSRLKYEYARQKAIASQAIAWMDFMHIGYRGTRAEDVAQAGSVDAYAARFEPKG